MTYETLEIIHGLLLKEVQKAERKDKAAQDELNQAYRTLEEIEGEHEQETAVVEEAKKELEKIKAKWNATRHAMTRTVDALNEFERHEWR